DLSGGVIDGAVEGVFGSAAKPFIRGGVDLDKLAGMRLALTAMGPVADFFLLGAFFSGIFQYTGKSGVGNGDSEIRE
ncbi:hypothetical protein NE619_18505, partial [Anaerovorax odorimutans]